LKCLSRPEIESSWSHGIAFLEHPGAPSLSTFVTFCGHGEIVEYQLNRRENEAGFLEEVLGWKKVGQLGSSGEWILSADVDDDGQTEVCVASGYARGKAAIQIYSGELAGGDLRLERTIDEGGRFTNVRFLVGDTRGDGRPDLVAWWCPELDNSECAVIAYRLGPEGIRERTVLAQGISELLWPRDGQYAVHDLDAVYQRRRRTLADRPLPGARCEANRAGQGRLRANCGRTVDCPDSDRSVHRHGPDSAPADSRSAIFAGRVGPASLACQVSMSDDRALLKAPPL
jgi:hypothetical protein